MTTTEYEKKLLNDIVNSILYYDIKKRICSIIVTGSFGRHEETFEFIDKSFKLKSDVEIALVYNSFTSKRYLNNLIENVASKFEEELNLMSLSRRRISKTHNFNNTLFTPRYKTLFTYDLYNGSYTIWGEKLIEKLPIRLSEVDKYEAKRIVANRIAEYIHIENLKKNDNYIKKQWACKIMLSIGSAWLIMHDKYE